MLCGRFCLRSLFIDTHFDCVFSGTDLFMFVDVTAISETTAQCTATSVTNPAQWIRLQTGLWKLGSLFSLVQDLSATLTAILIHSSFLLRFVLVIIGKLLTIMCSLL
jgi:hypothetical protein